MIHNEIHYKGYIAKTYGKSSAVVLEEKTNKEKLHTGFYSGEGTDEDLKELIDLYIYLYKYEMKQKLDELVEKEETEDDDI